MSATQVIIVGGGFGGINAAKILAREPEVNVLLIDRRNHHLFQPLLYQVAMAGLSPAEIAMPIRSIFRKSPRVDVLLAEVTAIDRKRKEVQTSAGARRYDYLILACGAEHSYFGHNDWEDFAPGLKTLEQATEIRRRVLTAFERAEADGLDTKAQLTFAVVGGGPTGVELAGALGELTHFTLAQDFRHIDPNRTRVLLIEAGPRLLASFPEALGQRAAEDLKTLGVEIRTGSRVSAINADGLTINGQFEPAKTVIWAAGVKPSSLNPQLGAELDPQGRVHVTPELSLAQDSHIFVIGDQAHVRDKSGQPLPGLAPVAMQQGRFVARQILRDLKRTSRLTFHYKDKGQMATIGRKRAVAKVGRLNFSGLVAWLLWLLIHIYYLIGFRNRLFVLWSWTYSYLTYRRGARLITERDWHLKN